MTHEEATTACIAQGQKLGRLLARQVMNRVLLLDLTPADLEAEIDSAMADARCAFLEGGADPDDAKTMMSVIKIALAEEGARLSLLSTFETGTA